MVSRTHCVATETLERTHLEDSQSVASTDRVIEIRSWQGCHQTAHRHDGEVPVVRVAEEQGVLVGVDQVEYGQTHHFPQEHHTHQHLVVVVVMVTGERESERGEERWKEEEKEGKENRKHIYCTHIDMWDI